MTEACTHDLEKLDEGELADLRKQARRNRPPMAWVEEGHRCRWCEGIEAVVSWYGQVYRVAVDRTDNGGLSVRWPKRSDTPGTGMSMG